jgi:hypothetical protein
MERLTCRVKNHVLLNVDKTFEDYNEAFEKLAEYEDLEEHGLLVRLPCKVGDTVYVIDEFSNYQIEENEIHGIKYKIRNNYNKIYFELNVRYMESTDIGETLFLTKQEAEQALAKLESEV